MRFTVIAALSIMLLAACSTQTAQVEPSSPSAEGTASVVGSATETALPSPTATASFMPSEPDASATPSAEATAEPYGAGAFDDPDSCANDEWGWRVAFPESWWTNTEFTHSDGEPVSACWMFSADRFDPRASEHANAPAPGAEIHLQVVPPYGLVGTSGELVTQSEATVGGFPGTRTEWAGSEDETTDLRPGDRLLWYSVQLPDDSTFMAIADNRETDDDFEEVMRVLDAMMETIEFRAG